MRLVDVEEDEGWSEGREVRFGIMIEVEAKREGEREKVRKQKKREFESK